MPDRRRISPPSPKQGERLVVQESSDDRPPRWCLAHLRNDYDANRLQVSQKALFLDHLIRRSSLTWRQIKAHSRTKLGCEAIPGASIKDGIPDIAAGQVILCFRLGDGGRFLGVRKEETFHVVWIDCQFKLYSH